MENNFSENRISSQKQDFPVPEHEKEKIAELWDLIACIEKFYQKGVKKCWADFSSSPEAETLREKTREAIRYLFEKLQSKLASGEDVFEVARLLREIHYGLWVRIAPSLFEPRESVHIREDISKIFTTHFESLSGRTNVSKSINEKVVILQLAMQCGRGAWKELKEKIKPFLKQFIDVPSFWFQSMRLKEEYARYLIEYIKLFYSDSGDFEIIKSLVSGSAQERAVGLEALSGLYHPQHRYSNKRYNLEHVPAEQQDTEQHIRNFIQGFGLDADDILDAWDASIHRHISKPLHSVEVSKALFMNLYTLNEIERERPGSARYFTVNCGVKAFGRYAPDILCDVYDNRENASKRYGVYFVARDDHFGAYYSSRQHGALEELHNSCAESGILLRIMEWGSDAELLRLHRALNDKYGASQKIQFSVFLAHGNTDGIVYGALQHSAKHSLRHEMTRDKIRKPIVLSFLRKYYADMPTLIFEGCNVARKKAVQEQSFAHILSSHGAHTIAPAQASYGIENFGIKMVNGKPEFSVTYAEGIKTHEYIGGKEISRQKKQPKPFD